MTFFRFHQLYPESTQSLLETFDSQIMRAIQEEEPEFLQYSQIEQLVSFVNIQLTSSYYSQMFAQ
jgi:hypothetical protein